ncbi:hypothetical protein Tco_0222715 [Tanacetum coccineum]
MGNIKMTMSIMQLNSKFVNNMLPEWGRFVTAVKLNKGLRDSNYDQLYAYLKQHEAHANENKMMLDRFTQHTVDPLALMSNVSHQQYYSQSSATPPSTHVQPHFVDNTQLDSGLSPTDNLIENLTNTLSLRTQSYKTYLPQTNNQLGTSSNTRNQTTVQDGRVVVQNDAELRKQHEAHEIAYNVQPQSTLVDSNADYTGVSNMITRKNEMDKMKPLVEWKQNINICPPDYSKENYLATFTPQTQLTPSQIFWSKDVLKMKAEALKEQTPTSRPIKALTVYPPNTPAVLVPTVLPTKSQVKINIFALIQLFSEFEKTCKKRITPTGLTEGERGFEQTKECYLTEVIPFFKILKEYFEGIQKALTKEIKEMKEIFEELEAEVDQNIVNRKYNEIEQKNLLIANDNLIVDCLSKEVFYIATNSELTVSRFTEMHDAHTIVQARCLELEAELSKLHDNVQKDDHTELVKRFSNLEVNHLNLQLKYQNLKEIFGNNTSPPAQEAPDFNSVFVIEKMKASIQGKDNAIKKLRMQISQLKETHSEADRTLDFRALDFQITQLTEKIMCAKHIEQTTALLTKNENLKAQIHENMKCITMDSVKPSVLAPGRYAIDVEPIPPRNRNNREVHLDYLKHLKESVETLREIVEEAKVERSLDRSLASACFYTKHSQELLEYVIGTWKLNIEKTNALVIPSTGVNSCTDASGSQPRSNTKKNRISPAKSVNKKKVEEHPRTNKSSLKTTNRVDSSISSKRTVINLNSHSVCQTYKMAYENVPAPAPIRYFHLLHSFQLDETRFVLDANVLREGLEITPIDQAYQFVSPPSGDAIMDFVNKLGYTKARLLEFVQAIQTFLTDKANLGSPTKKSRKDKAHVIPYCRFTKLIICHLGRTHNIQQRSASLFHLAEEDLGLGNLKFVPKGEEDEVFRMPIPNELISKNIRNAPYYNAYLEMVAKHDRKITAEKEGKKKPATVKQPKPKLAK